MRRKPDIIVSIKLVLPPKTRRLIEAYFNLRIGPFTLPCPYFQNVAGKGGSLVFVGKGTPEELEEETLKLYKKNKKDPKNYSPSVVRHYMVMAGLGIDCSGFVARVLEVFLREKGFGSLIKKLRPVSLSPLSLARHYLRPFSNLSANSLTSEVNCQKITDYNSVLPGGLLRIGPGHIAIISEVEKEEASVKAISYTHSTSDYLDQHGVRHGKIIIVKPGVDLTKQKWDETYRGRNWMYEDFLKCNPNDGGIRRLRVLQNL